MNYEYFEVAVVGFINSIMHEFHNYKYNVGTDKFPVRIQTSGDVTYHEVRSDRLEILDKSDTVKIPLMDLQLRNISLKQDELTQPQHEGRFVLDVNGVKTEKMRPFRVMPMGVSFDASVWFSNIFQYLAFVEYILNGGYLERNFKFMYFDKYQDAQWKITTTDFSIEYDGVMAYGQGESGILRTELNIELHLPYYSFYLNNSLGEGGIGRSTGDALNDLEGDGSGQGGEGGSGNLPNINEMDASNVIKKVTYHIDEENIDNKIASRDYTNDENN